MKSLIQAVAVALVLSAPVVSFAQSSTQASPDSSQATQAQSYGQQQATPADSTGYGSAGHGSWQAGHRGGDTTVSSYSPPVYNAR
ncbi:hypothetical protein [Paraburkholderia sp. BCC1886]|uniref:hypothetical protein n=1 Tax=Paraburkholderia sp. BCC1886 TaxID=2562670 RepID=UPI0011837351|nr:hypothetical protein [Paraburkholderia sp. BCC1886]